MSYSSEKIRLNVKQHGDATVFILIDHWRNLFNNQDSFLFKKLLFYDDIYCNILSSTMESKGIQDKILGKMSVLARDKIMTREIEMCQPTKHPSFNNVRL